MCGNADIHFKHDGDGAVLDCAAAHVATSLKHRGPDAFSDYRTACACSTPMRCTTGRS